jgi:hypothetical protein
VSKAHQILDSLRDLEEPEGPFLLGYTFQPRTSTQFYVNLKRVIEETGDGERVQPSVYLFRTLKPALAVWRLALDYGAQVFFCRAHPEDPGRLFQEASKEA